MTACAGAHKKIIMKWMVLLGAMVGLVSCSTVTLENRRDLYQPEKVEGPYTRMLKDGIPDPNPPSDTGAVPDGEDGRSWGK